MPKTYAQRSPFFLDTPEVYSRLLIAAMGSQMFNASPNSDRFFLTLSLVLSPVCSVMNVVLASGHYRRAMPHTSDFCRYIWVIHFDSNLKRATTFRLMRRLTKGCPTPSACF